MGWLRRRREARRRDRRAAAAIRNFAALDRDMRGVS